MFLVSSQAIFIWAKSQNGTTLKSSNSIRRCTHAPGCPISRLPWCGARTARAPARSGPIIYRRPTRNGNRPLAKAQPSAGRRASGGKGNDGVAAFVGRLKGAIGYIEWSYAKQNKISYVRLRNPEGAIVAPNVHTFKAALER